MLRPFLFALVTTACPGSLAAHQGLLVVAHGGSQDWNHRVLETVASVVWTRGPIATAFLMGPAAKAQGWTAGVETLVARGATSIVVVPLMVSSAGAHYRQIEYYAGARASLPPALAHHSHERRTPAPVPIYVSRALDDAAELGNRVDALWAELPREDRRPAVMFVGHGPTADDDAKVWIEGLARALGPFAQRRGVRFGVGLLRDDAPGPARSTAIAALRARIEHLGTATGDSVTVLPLLISWGGIATVTIPRDLAGLPIRYTPVSLAPSPQLSRWIERSALARLESTP